MPDQTSTALPPWLTPILTATLGFIAAIIIERFKNRTVLLKSKRNVFQLATATKNSFWGDIEVLYNDRKTNHLSLITIEIKNDSNIDLENVNVDFWVDENSQMLAYQGNYNENGNSILLEEKYAKEFGDVIKLNKEDMRLKEENPTHETSPDLRLSLRYILANKTLNLPVFNRNTSIKIQLLCENFIGQVPKLSVSILHKSCKVVQEEDEVEAKLKRDRYAGILWFILYGIVVAYVYSKYSNQPIAVIWTGILAIVSLYAALGIYEILRRLKRLLK